MSEHEMQFADPEWRPQEDRMVQARQEASAPYVPQPINRDPREPAMWQTSVSAPPRDVPPVQPEPYADGYAPQRVRGRQYGGKGRKSRNYWFWIIAIIIGFSLLKGEFSRDIPPHGPPGFSGPQIPWQTQSLAVGNAPTIIIHGHVGSIHVNTGGDANQVMMNIANKDAVHYDKDSNQLTVNMDGFSDLNVTVPSNATLQIDTQSGNIQVQGVDGQMALTSDSGRIHVEQSTLKGQSYLQSNSGSVSFAGSLDPNGSYLFKSNSDDVNVTLPSTASFHVDASTDTGSIDSDFSSVGVQQTGSGGNQAHANVGNQPGPTITLQTNSSAIHLHQSS